MAAAAVGVVAYLTRDQMLPTPQTSDEPPPKFRGGSDAAPAAAVTSEDLTQVKGIGPTYAARLADISISTRAALVDADAATVAEAVGTSVSAVESWQADATR